MLLVKFLQYSGYSIVMKKLNSNDDYYIFSDFSLFFPNTLKKLKYEKIAISPSRSLINLNAKSHFFLNL